MLFIKNTPIIFSPNFLPKTDSTASVPGRIKANDHNETKLSIFIVWKSIHRLLDVTYSRA